MCRNCKTPINSMRHLTVLSNSMSARRIPRRDLTIGRSERFRCKYRLPDSPLIDDTVPGWHTQFWPPLRYRRMKNLAHLVAPAQRRQCSPRPEANIRRPSTMPNSGSRAVMGLVGLRRIADRLRHGALQLRQQHDALLFVRISPRNQGDAGFCFARIVRKMRDVSWNIEELAGLQD